ncbi:craniofacial development protein 1-like isoform X1 [Salvelinus namaycush]|uniref:Craniofacial development protein 1-like isoform X1 n=1 Tax=Salvelinus namaycush TaxID=8040 RepID=A0A8U1FC09_SALNM|nr:craniofacial development protein 1-like isoform X1 [Salvelinus namaycush]
MNYSDYDSDGYSSNADQDYVPSDDNLSEDDMNECVKEDGLEGDDQRGQQSDNVTKKKKKKGQHIGMRKRKKGGLKLEETLHDGSVEDQKVEQGEEREFSTPRPKKEEDEEKKKKADDLWASFLSDVGHKSKPPTPVPQATTKQQAVPTDSSKKPISAPSEPQQPEPKEPSKVTITKVFDFAGEEVRVSKEVDADSKEAKSFLKAKEETPYVQTVPRRFEPSSLAPGLRTSSWPGSADERMRSSWVHPLQVGSSLSMCVCLGVLHSLPVATDIWMSPSTLPVATDIWRSPSTLPVATDIWRSPSTLPVATDIWRSPSTLPVATDIWRSPSTLPVATDIWRNPSALCINTQSKV